MELNKEQKEAIEKTDGKISVVAGPGSGKTRVLIERVLNLIKMGKPQSKILLITFTNKVREEIIERLFNEIGENDVKIHTFHSFASEIIKKYFKEINVNKNLKILDEDDLKLLILESQYALISENEIFKNEAIDIDEFIKSGLYKNKLSLKSVFTKKLVDKFNLLKSENNYSTYDDLIESLFLILKKVKLRNQIVKTIDYLMIDECQDLNEEQYVIVELLEKSEFFPLF
jgi:superfamily I DNA/RNA helicase